MILMLSFNLSSVDDAGKLTRMCEKYKDQMEIDIICGRQTIDAYSILGVYSLVGHVVSIEPQTDDADLMEIFGEDLERIKNGKN